MLDPHILHRLHHTALDVARVRRLDGGIDETLTTAHGVEEVLGRAQTLDEGGLDESTRFNTVIELGEVRKRAVLERVLDTLAINDLLAEEGYHLGNIQTRTLSARINHLNKTVGGRERLDHGFGDLGRDVLQSIVNLVLQFLAVGAPAVVEELAGVDVREDFLDTLAPLCQRLGYECGGLRIGFQIGSAGGEAGEQIELGHNRLDFVNKLSATLVTEIVEEDVEHTFGCGGECALLQEPLGEDAVLDRDTAVEVHEGECSRDDVHARVRLVRADEGGERAAEFGHDIHRNMFGDLDSRVGDAEGTCERILNHLNDRGIITRAHDETENARKLLEFRLCRH